MSIRRIDHSGGLITLSTSIAGITSGAISAAVGSVNLQGLTPDDFPHIRFVLGITFATATGIENKVVELCSRPLDVDGTTDTPVPTATYRNVVGTFRLKNDTNLQTLVCDVFDADPNAEYYLYQESGQASSINASLKALPFTYDNVA